MAETPHELDAETIRDIEEEIRLCQEEIDRAEVALKFLGMQIESKIALGESAEEEKAKFTTISEVTRDLKAVISGAQAMMG